MTEILVDDPDPRVVELVTAIRDRFGLRGLRGAHRLIEKEIAVAEAAIAELAAESAPGAGPPSGVVGAP